MGLLSMLASGAEVAVVQITGTTAACSRCGALIKVGETLVFAAGMAEHAVCPPQAPYYDPVTGRCPHGTRKPHECRDGCEE